MLPINLLALIQAQITLERTNEAHYRNLAAAADVVNRPGAVAYFTSAANDEADHARRFVDFLIDRNERPKFDALPALEPFNGNDYAGMFRAALVREQLTTAALTTLYQMADEESLDPQTIALLLNPSGDFPGFMVEQTKSERELTDFLTSITRLSEDGLEIFDSNLVG